MEGEEPKLPLALIVDGCVYVLASVVLGLSAFHVLHGCGIQVEAAVSLYSLALLISWYAHMMVFPSRDKTRLILTSDTASHYACLGTLVWISRTLEFYVLASSSVVVHQATWAMLPAFYILADLLWPEFAYAYSPLSLLVLALSFGAYSATLILNPDVTFVAAFVGLLWIATKSQAIVYGDFLRVKKGLDPVDVYFFTNAFSAGVAFCVWLVYAGKHVPPENTWGSVLWCAVMALGALAYGVYFFKYDAPPLREGKDQRLPFRSHARMGLTVLFALMLFPAPPVHVALGVALLPCLAAVHKHVQRRLAPAKVEADDVEKDDEE